MKIEKFPAGKRIITEGEYGDEAYRIIEGSVEISVQEEGHKLVLATLGEGEIFGEMAMIENRPRSASARFLETSTVEVIGREDFQQVLASGGEQLVPYLTTIFDRLRVTNERLLAALAQLDQLEPMHGRHHQEVFYSESSAITVQIDPDSHEMQQKFNSHSRAVKRFPFMFGRRPDLVGDQEIVQNQLLVADRSPYRVSRKHCILDMSSDGVFIEDRNSSLGTIVNGTPIGANTGETRVRLNSGVNTLILGGVDSQVRFNLTVLDASEN